MASSADVQRRASGAGAHLVDGLVERLGVHRADEPLEHALAVVDAGSTHHLAPRSGQGERWGAAPGASCTAQRMPAASNA